MKRLWKESLLILARSANLGLPYLVLLVLLSAHFAFCFANYQRYGDVFSTLVRLVRPAIFMVAFFIYCGYELAVKLFDNNMAEYIRTCERGLMTIYGALVSSLLTVVALPAAMFLTFIGFMYLHINARYLPFLAHLLRLSVLYFGLSFVIGVMLGVVMAAKLRTNRLAVYSLTTVFVLLNTTFTDVLFRVPYLLFDSVRGERFLYWVKDFLTVVPHQLGSVFGIQPIYGFPLEPIRWALAVVWIAFLSTLLLTECCTREVNRTLKSVSCLIVVVGVALFSGRGSVWTMDRRSDSYAYGDPTYYMDSDEPEGQDPKSVAGFAIEEYRMDLTISNELHATVEATVDNPNLRSYEFTLYHGYVLDSVRSEAGAIPFARQGDHISVGELGARRIVFRYHGSSPKYCSNRQVVTLPGYFPYYPKAGRMDIFDLDRYGYVLNVPPSESSYTVNVRSGQRVFSNLAGRDGSFQGTADGLTLFAGMYDEVAAGIFAEPMREDQPKREYAQQAEALLADIYRRLGRQEPEAFQGISDMKLFQVPRSIGVNSNTEDTVVMSDHILCISCSDGRQLAEGMLRSVLVAKKPAIAYSNLSSRYVAILLGREGETQPTPHGAVDLRLLVEELEEWRMLSGKHAGVTRKDLAESAEQARNAYSAEADRMWDLERTISEKAAEYLFCDSPRKEENLRVFYDYFTSDGSEDCFQLVERLVREELQRAGN